MRDENSDAIGINGKEDRLPSAVIDTSFLRHFCLELMMNTALKMQKTK